MGRGPEAAAAWRLRCRSRILQQSVEHRRGGVPGGTDSGGAPDAGAGGSAALLRLEATPPVLTVDGAGGTVSGCGCGEDGSFGTAGASPVPATPHRYSSASTSKAHRPIRRSNWWHSDTADLSTCKVLTYFNGKSEASVVAVLSGRLVAGEVLTLCTSALTRTLPETCQQVANLTFNGNDAIALSCSGQIVDFIGQLGVDPGQAWGIGSQHHSRPHIASKVFGSERSRQSWPIRSEPKNGSPSRSTPSAILGSRGC